MCAKPPSDIRRGKPLVVVICTCAPASNRSSRCRFDSDRKSAGFPRRRLPEGDARYSLMRRAACRSTLKSAVRARRSRPTVDDGGPYLGLSGWLRDPCPQPVDAQIDASPNRCLQHLVQPSVAALEHRPQVGGPNSLLGWVCGGVLASSVGRGRRRLGALDLASASPQGDAGPAPMTSTLCPACKPPTCERPRCAWW